MSDGPQVEIDGEMEMGATLDVASEKIYKGSNRKDYRLLMLWMAQPTRGALVVAGVLRGGSL